MNLTEFILRFEFNLVAADTLENNIIRLYDDKNMESMGVITRFEDYQQFYSEFGNYEIVQLEAGSEPHVIELIIRKE